jgi:hypothetical protein
MESDRFDALTQQFAVHRRGVLRALGAAIATFVLQRDLDSTEARSNCRVVCHRHHGRRVCRRVCRRPPPPPAPPAPPPPPPRPCIGLNVACTTLDVCCPGSCGIVNPQKALTRCDTTLSAFVAQCCLSERAACTNDCQCCGALRCQNGVCAPPPNICHAVGESCADGEPCCAAAATCVAGRCCHADGAACPAACSASANCQGCCAGFCRDDGRCGPVGGCQGYGQPCTISDECCNAVPCIGPGAGGQASCHYP